MVAMQMIMIPVYVNLNGAAADSGGDFVQLRCGQTARHPGINIQPERVKGFYTKGYGAKTAS